MDAVDAAMRSGADYLGFIFYPPSPRHVSLDAAAGLTRSLPAHISTVPVLVNPDDAELQQLFSVWRPDMLQLHGDEPPRRVSAIKRTWQVPTIKSLPMAARVDAAQINDYSAVADYVLLDTKDNGLRGGTGRPFDWSLLQEVTLPLPWFLSGGLTSDNVEEGLRITRAPMVDVSSGIESARGVKDPAKIAAFNETVRSISL